MVGLLKWLSGKESTCQCRRSRSNPWVRKILWRLKWQPTTVFLLRKSHGQRSLMVCVPWGDKELDATEQLSTGQENLKTISSSLFSTDSLWYPHRERNRCASVSISLSVCAEPSHTIFSIEQEPNHCLDFK